MKTTHGPRLPRRSLMVSLPLLVAVFVLGGGVANADDVTPIGLGTATDFAVRAGDTVTNDTTLGPSVITGAVGLSPGTSYTGLTCAQVNGGAGPIYSTNGTGPPGCPGGASAGLLNTVENDARAAFNHASSLPATALGVTDLSLLAPLVAGVYSFGADATANITTSLSLDAQNNPASVWIFQASSTLVTASGSTIGFVNAPANVNLACNVFWTVGSSATLHTGSTFVGTILANTDINVDANVTVLGRLLAANAAGAGGQVTLITDTITRPDGCVVVPAGTGGTPVPGSGTPGTPGTPVLTDVPGLPSSPAAPPLSGTPRLTG